MTASSRIGTNGGALVSSILKVPIILKSETSTRTRKVMRIDMSQEDPHISFAQSLWASSEQNALPLTGDLFLGATERHVRQSRISWFAQSGRYAALTGLAADEKTGPAVALSFLFSGIAKECRRC